MDNPANLTYRVHIKIEAAKLQINAHFNAGEEVLRASEVFYQHPFVPFHQVHLAALTKRFAHFIYAFQSVEARLHGTRITGDAG